ncbi:MAG: regulatory protein RecX [Candidatus Woesearchaeota archaeon]
MPEITSIERQKKRDNRVNVFVDGNFFVGLTDKQLIDFDIYKGKKVSEKELNKIKNQSNYGKIKDKAISLISIRPRSKKELKDKLILKKYDLSLIDEVIKDLEKEKLLDDKIFAKQWVYHRTEFSGLGKRKIELELFKKGVNKDIAKKEVSKITDNQQFDKAFNLALKKYSLIKNEDKYKKIEKTSAFLARKGYSWHIIKKVLDRLKN